MKTAELNGAILDYWVARAEGAVVHSGDWTVLDFPGGGRRIVGDRGLNNHWSPSTDWASGGPIIEREYLQIVPPAECNRDRIEGWSCYIEGVGKSIEQFGATPLIAAMRAFVASKFGDEVSD